MRALGLVVMLTLIPSVASAGSGWAVKCPYSHSNNDDPIKFPRQQGATHLHDFYGSMTTNYLSTYSSMRASPSTCGTAGDTSGYWAPALYRNGVRVFPQGSFDGEETREQFYYRKDNLSSGTTVEPFPANFKMIQGYAMAMSLADANAQGAEWGSEMYWGCSDNNPDDKFTAPISCRPGSSRCTSASRTAGTAWRSTATRSRPGTCAFPRTAPARPASPTSCRA